MRKIASILVSVVLVAAICAPAFAGTLFQRTMNSPNPLIQNNYICDSNAFGIDLLCGTQAIWSFEQSAYDGTAGEVIDSSGKGNHGIAVNGANTTASGKLRRAALFSKASNQHINVVTTWPDFTAITISSWVYPVSDAAISTIIGSEAVGGSGMQLRMDATTRVVSIFGNSLTDTLQQSLGYPLTLNAWNHVIYVFDGTNSWFFINGVKNNIQAQGGFIRMRSTVHIGRTNDVSSDRDMDGRLDELIPWDRALSDDEAIDYFNNSRGKYIQ